MTDRASSPGKFETWRARLCREIGAAGKVSILGIGNVSRGDDAAGIEAAEALSAVLSGLPTPERKVQVIKAFEAPENHTGTIRAFGPDLVVLVDAAAGGNRPGTVFFVDPSSIDAEDISTHRIPLSALVRYLQEDIACRVLVLGIEPRSLRPGNPLSPPVRRALRALVRAISRAVVKPLNPADVRSSSASGRRCS